MYYTANIEQPKKYRLHDMKSLGVLYYKGQRSFLTLSFFMLSGYFYGAAYSFGLSDGRLSTFDQRIYGIG